MYSIGSEIVVGFQQDGKKVKNIDTQYFPSSITNQDWKVKHFHTLFLF